MSGFGLFQRSGGRAVFERDFQGYSMLVAGKEQYDTYGKIILPQSALTTLLEMEISYPMLFQVTNHSTGKNMYCGVIEFSAQSSSIQIPSWMMRGLGGGEGDILRVKNVTLPLGSFVKLQPQSVAFLDISNPRAVLEKTLGNMSCLSSGQIFEFSYNNRVYKVKVVECRPGKAISIVETDIEVDFAPPVGYVEPKARVVPVRPTKFASDDEETDDESSEDEEASKFVAFSSGGSTLKGKKSTGGSSLSRGTSLGGSSLGRGARAGGSSLGRGSALSSTKVGGGSSLGGSKAGSSAGSSTDASGTATPLTVREQKREERRRLRDKAAGEGITVIGGGSRARPILNAKSGKSKENGAIQVVGGGNRARPVLAKIEDRKQEGVSGLTIIGGGNKPKPNISGTTGTAAGGNAASFKAFSGSGSRLK